MVGSNNGEADLRTILRTVWRHKRAIIGPTLIILAATFIHVSLITPKYKSEARVLLELNENTFLRPEMDKSPINRSTIDQETLTNQVQFVLSRDLAAEMIKQLGLADLPEFNLLPDDFSLMTIPRMIGLARDPRSMSLEERLMGAYYDRLSAKTVDKSRVIMIEFQSVDPELAARATNAIAEGYLAMQQLAKQNQVRSASQWLTGEVEKLRNQVAEAEAKVEDFRAKSNIILGVNNNSLSSQELSELNAQISTGRAQKADADTRARLIRDQLRSGQPLESSDVTASQLIRHLSERRVTLRAQLAKQSSTLLAEHPRIKEIRAQIGNLDLQIRTEGERLVRSLEYDAKVAGARLDALDTNLDQLKRQAASTSEQDVQLRAHEREAKALRYLFESYLAKYSEAIARDKIAVAPADARIISRAVVSNLPASPNKLSILSIAALATFCLSFLIVVIGAVLGGVPYRVAPTPFEPSSAEYERRAGRPDAGAPASITLVS